MAVVVFLVLGFVGFAVPHSSAPGSEAMIDESGSWPVAAILLIALIGAFDLWRRHPLGVSVMAGVAAVFVPLQIVMGRIVQLIGELSGTSTFGIGFYAWTGAAIASIVLLVGLLGAPQAAGSQRVPPAVAIGLAGSGVLWLVGNVIPDDPGMSIMDWLFGDDAAINLAVVLWLAGAATIYVVAAIRRTLRSFGMALGAALSWLSIWASSASETDDGVGSGVWLSESSTVIAIGIIGLVGFAGVGILAVCRSDEETTAGARWSWSAVAGLSGGVVMVGWALTA